MTTKIEIAPIVLTSSAAEIVRNMFRQRDLDDSFSLRVYVAGRSCSGLQYGMAFDKEPAETDSTFESEGLKIVVDEQSIQYMAGSIIDYIDDERGKGFLVNNPNNLPSCSCESGTCGTSDD